MWASAYGVFTNVVTVEASVPFPKTVNGVKVSIGGVDSAIWYVSATQINFQIPFASAPGLRTVVVTTPTTTYNGNVRVMPSSPGLIPKDLATPPKGAIINNQNHQENSTTNRALRGGIIEIYAVGPGPLSQALTDGAITPLTGPLVTTVSTPQVFIGGVEAQVQFSGMTPGSVGLWQINAFIPDLPFITGRMPVQVFLDGVDSNEVTVFVQ
jgi:uncharacterized protein (TIGR03437 family)